MNVYISATQCPRELKLVSNDCYDNILQSCNKIYKQAYFLVAQIFKKTSYSRKITAKRRRYTSQIANILVTKSSRELKLVSNHC